MSTEDFNPIHTAVFVPVGGGGALRWYFDSVEEVAQAVDAVRLLGADRGPFTTVDAVPAGDFVSDAAELSNWLTGDN